MVFNERRLSDGLFALDWNNGRSAQRGTFVDSGGVVSVGGSSSALALDASAVEFAVDGTAWSAPSGQVTLAPNTTGTPRRDAVLARAGDTDGDPGTLDVLTGDPITDETMAALTNTDQAGGARLNQDGTPIYRPVAIPQVQPPAGEGLRKSGVVLAMVFVPPGTSDSTDLAPEYVTDLRMEGIGVGDVVRQSTLKGDIGGVTASFDNPIDTVVDGAVRFWGRTYAQFQRQQAGETVQQTLDPGQTYTGPSVVVPDTHRMRTWAIGVAARSNTDTGIEAYIATPDGGHNDVTYTTSGLKTSTTAGEPLANATGPLTRTLDINNPTSTARDTTGRFVYTIEPRDSKG